MDESGLHPDPSAPQNTALYDAARLAFEAGRLAEAKGIQDCRMVAAPQIDTEPPQGPPLIVTAQRQELSESRLRSVAALHGAGRTVLVVSMEPMDEGAAWLAGDLVHVIGTPLQGAVAAAEPEPTPPPANTKPPETPPPPPIPPFSDLRLFGGVHPDPIGEAAQRWQNLRQRLRWPLEEVPLPEEGAYAWFGIWPLEAHGPAALIRFQPYEFAGVQVLQVESSIGQVAATNLDLERVGSAAQRQFASAVTMACEPEVLQHNGTQSWTSETPSAVARGIILDEEPPLPLAMGQQRIAARMTVGTTGVYLHYLIPAKASFDTSVTAVADAVVSTHRKLWEMCTAPSGEPPWLQCLHFTSAAELTLHAAQGQVVCGACGIVGLIDDEFCGRCGARWR